MTQPIKDTLAALDSKILKLQVARDTLAVEFCNTEQTDWPIRPMGMSNANARDPDVREFRIAAVKQGISGVPG